MFLLYVEDGSLVYRLIGIVDLALIQRLQFFVAEVLEVVEVLQESGMDVIEVDQQAILLCQVSFAQCESADEVKLVIEDILEVSRGISSMA